MTLARTWRKDHLVEMKMLRVLKRSLGIGLLILVSMIHAACEPTNQLDKGDELPSSMKGYELYSWLDEEDESWQYTLITGTNRLKTVEEISSLQNELAESEWVKITVTGTEQLEALLMRLPPGSNLSWDLGRLAQGQDLEEQIFEYPDAIVVESIRDLCRQQKINLHLSQ